MKISRRWPVIAGLTLLAAGCGGGSPAVVIRPPSSTSAPVPTAPAPASPSAPPSGQGQQVTVTPAVGLRSGQQVLVQAAGFAPGESLVVTECADKGTATGPGDCNLTNLQAVTADAAGRVTISIMVTQGPFGANNIVCGPAQACLISVTQPVPSPTQQGTAPISFG